MASPVTSQQPPEAVTSIRIFSLNCWGLKYISKYRIERMLEIGNRIAAASPSHDIVGLQECWTWHDYQNIRDATRHVLPYGKFYNSGIFGGGLAILSRWPIEEASMYGYPLNGRPTAFFRGDWYVGKGVAQAKIRTGDGQLIEVFNTHLHAPYEREPNDSYICHRTAQAWEIAKLMRAATERGSLVVGLGDFNMVPMSFAHVLIESRGNVRDVWRILRPDTSIGASIDVAEAARRKKTGEKTIPGVDESLNQHGHTCDSVLNTWRWNKGHQQDLKKGLNRTINLTDADPRAKRLDYIFFGGTSKGWEVKEVKVSMTERHPTLLCSLSDHFAVEAVIGRGPVNDEPVDLIRIDTIQSRGNDERAGGHEPVSLGAAAFAKVISEKTVESQPTTGFYEDILAMIHKYELRERQQRRYRLSHFVEQALASIGCFVAVWWSPRNYVAFILILFSTFGIMAGTIDGLIGGLFVGSELRALKEFEWEVRNALQLAGGPVHEEERLRDWYD